MHLQCIFSLIDFHAIETYFEIEYSFYFTTDGLQAFALHCSFCFFVQSSLIDFPFHLFHVCPSFDWHILQKQQQKDGKHADLL